MATALAEAWDRMSTDLASKTFAPTIRAAFVENVRTGGRVS